MSGVGVAGVLSPIGEIQPASFLLAKRLANCIPPSTSNCKERDGQSSWRTNCSRFTAALSRGRGRLLRQRTSLYRRAATAANKNPEDRTFLFSAVAGIDSLQHREVVSGPCPLQTDTFSSRISTWKNQTFRLDAVLAGGSSRLNRK